MKASPHTIEPVSGSPTLVVKDLRKSYGPTVALEKVDFPILPGEVHALLGENGAGKSTLVKILSGVVRADQGEITLAGRPYLPESITGARAAGVSTAFQEISLLPNLTVAQNLCLPNQPKNRLGLADWRKGEEAARAILGRFALSDIDPRARVSDLSLANRQRLEIARALATEPRLLVLDEPSAVQPSTDWLFARVHEATARGAAVLYVSHRLAEIRELCLHGTVLRSGTSIATLALSDVDDDGIFELMVGKRRSDQIRTLRKEVRSAEKRLQVSRLCAGQLRDVSLDVHAGEIVGVAGLDGQGQAELFHALFGLERIERGEIEVDGRKVSIDSPRAALRAGVEITLLPEERKTEGIFPFLSVQNNVVLAGARGASTAGVFRASAARRLMRRVSTKVDLAERYFDFRINELSGGNQQKALLARVLQSGARTLLLFDPTRGVDVGTKDSIYSAIRDFAATGGSVLLYSSELMEITALCDRCLVVYAGRIVAELPRELIDETAIVAAATGHAEILRHAA